MSSTLWFPQGPIYDKSTGLLSLEWFEWLQNPQFASIILGSAVPVGSGGTGLTSGTSGGILGFTASDTIASSVELTAGHLVVGGGSGATPTPLAAGTSTQVLHGNASGSPTWSAVSLSADVTGTLAVTNGGTGSATALVGSSIMVSNGSAIVQGPTGTTTLVLHGNASGQPSYSAVVEADMSLSDVTTLNVSTTKHGFVPKAPNDTTKFLRGDATWSTVSVTAAAVSAVGYWSPLTNGDPVTPELIWDSFGDTVAVWTGL